MGSSNLIIGSEASFSATVMEGTPRTRSMMWTTPLLAPISGWIRVALTPFPSTVIVIFPGVPNALKNSRRPRSADTSYKNGGEWRMSLLIFCFFLLPASFSTSEMDRWWLILIGWSGLTSEKRGFWIISSEDNLLRMTCNWRISVSFFWLERRASKLAWPILRKASLDGARRVRAPSPVMLSMKLMA